MNKEEFNAITDLRPFLLRHPDHEMVRDACLHYLGDKYQNAASAEGAEEFLTRNHISGADFVYTTGFRNMVDLVTEFATLHAQQMAEAKLRELIARADYTLNEVFKKAVQDEAWKIAADMAKEKCKKCKYRGLPDSIQEALNSGDGVYRP